MSKKQEVAFSSMSQLTAAQMAFVATDEEGRRAAEVSSVTPTLLTLELDNGISLRVNKDSDDPEVKKIVVGSVLYYKDDGQWTGIAKIPPAPPKKVRVHAPNGSNEKARNF